MSNSDEASTSKKIKVGLFTLGGLLLMGVLSVYVNNRPFWWRACEPVNVTVEDATGLKTKAPVKSLGLEIGYISDIGLVADGVKLRICITAPVETMSDTKAYVRGEGFLGDRFLELKPVKYTGTHQMDDSHAPKSAQPVASPSAAPTEHSQFNVLKWMFGIQSASAQENGSPEVEPAGSNAAKNGRTIPVAGKTEDMQQLMTQMNGLVKDLKSAINPEEIRGTIRQLNKTLEDASKALSPQGGLTATAQRSLIKLEDTIEQLRDQVTRINQGQGSVGMVLNDPTYAEELKKALVSLNHLLNRAGDMRLNVILGINQLTAYNATRASFQVMIFPRPDRFYLIGLDADPRGSITQTTTDTSVNSGPSTHVATTQTTKGGFAITGLIGKVFTPRIDLGVGLIHGDGGARLGLNLGWGDNLDELQLMSELYFRTKTVDNQWTAQADGRIYLIFQPYSILFLSAGLEGFRKYEGSVSAFYGAGIRFEDEDIKLLFSFL